MSKVEIWQLKDSAPHGLWFADFSDLERYGLAFSQDNYRKVFEYCEENPDLEMIFVRFNLDDRPCAKTMHSLSVSDVVVVDGVAHYVCSGFGGDGFKVVPWETKEVAA